MLLGELLLRPFPHVALMGWYEPGVAPAAQVNLGNMYAQGLGTAQDLPQALVWYRKAEAQHPELVKDLIEYVQRSMGQPPREGAGDPTAVNSAPAPDDPVLVTAMPLSVAAASPSAPGAVELSLKMGTK